MPQITGNYIPSYENPYATEYIFVHVMPSSQSPVEPLVFLISCTKELHKLMHRIVLELCIKSVSIYQFKIPVLSTIIETAAFLLYRVKILNITHLLKMSNRFSTSFHLQFESGLNVPFLLLFPHMPLQRALQKSFGRICIFLNIFLGPPF